MVSAWQPKKLKKCKALSGDDWTRCLTWQFHIFCVVIVVSAGPTVLIFTRRYRHERPQITVSLFFVVVIICTKTVSVRLLTLSLSLFTPFWVRRQDHIIHSCLMHTPPKQPPMTNHHHTTVLLIRFIIICYIYSMQINWKVSSCNSKYNADILMQLFSMIMYD